MHSCIYEGNVMHRRFEPVDHDFNYRVFMMYLDLDEIDDVFGGRWLWSAHRPALARYKREAYPGEPGEPLDLTIRNMVERDSGHRPQGPIRLLTHLRYFGYGFNPVSFFYCFSPSGQDLEAVVAHVTSTPWGETHSYVVTPPVETSQDITSHLITSQVRTSQSPSQEDQVPRSGIVNSADKALHVSPFMPMALRHEFRFGVPSDRLQVHMTNRRQNRAVFSADLSMDRKEISTASLTAALAKYPFMTGRVVLGIYYQALRLYLKRIHYHPHPSLKPVLEKEPQP